MPEGSPKSPLVRCPKCGRPLPELPPYSAYSCGGCHGIFRAQKKSPLYDNLSENSLEARPTLVSRACDSPTRKSPVRWRKSDNLDVLAEFDIQGKSWNGDDRTSRLRGKGYGNGKPPAFSVRGGAGKSADTRSAKKDDSGRLKAVDSGLELRTQQDGKRADQSVNLYRRSHFGKVRVGVPVGSYDGSLNYRTQLIREYNRLHEKLIRISDLISCSQDGEEEQSFASKDCYGGPNYCVSDELSGLRISSVKSARHHHKKHAAQRSSDSIYNPSRKNLHRASCSCSDCHRRWTFDPAFSKHASQPKRSVDSKLDRGSLGNQNGELCYPVAGGAPFVICYNCFHLLRIPGKVAAAKKNQFRLQCGSCLSILSYYFDANDFTHGCKESEPCLELEGGSSFSSEATKISGFLASSSEESKDDHSSKTVVSESDIFSGGEKPSMNGLLPLRPPPGSISTEATKTSDFSASSSQESKDDHSSKTDVSSEMSGLLPLRPPPGSPFRDHKDYLFAIKGSEERELDALIGDKQTVQRKRSSVTFVGVPDTSTELEPNSGEIQKTGASPQSLNTLLSKADVLVNGKPVTPYALRSAEKVAGPISPGEYWYDPKAGFWGIMGDHCLGIIPPCIKEFSSQMAEDCSGGNTCVYVNGRELHKNDLDLLCSRGLPNTRLKYYFVDIYGKVLDADTGAFVVSLGKLAPTVESTGCGFGMYSPEG